MLICLSKIFSSTNVMLLGQVSTLKRRFLLSLFYLVVEEVFRNKSSLQTPITDFINQKEKHVSIRHNSILILRKSVAPIFGIDIMYMIYLDVKYFSVVCFSIYFEKPAIKTTLATMEHCFAKKLNFCLSDIICNSVA